MTELFKNIDASGAGQRWSAGVSELGWIIG
jgi:hypothetical protein